MPQPSRPPTLPLPHRPSTDSLNLTVNVSPCPSPSPNQYHGVCFYEKQTLHEAMAKLAANDFQLHAHTCGDQSLADLLEGFEKTAVLAGVCACAVRACACMSAVCTVLLEQTPYRYSLLQLQTKVSNSPFNLCGDD